MNGDSENFQSRQDISETGQDPSSGSFGTPAYILLICFIIAFSVLSVCASGLFALLFIAASAALLPIMLIYAPSNEKFIKISSALVSAAAAYAIGSFISTSFVYGLYALVPFVSGAVLTVCVIKKYNRTVATAAVTVSTALMFAAVSAAVIASVYGGLSAEIIKKMFGDEFDSIRQSLLAMSIQTADGELPLFDEASVNSTLNNIMLMLPSGYICFVSVISYITTSLFVLFTRLYHRTGCIPCRPWLLKMSIVSAYVFAASYLVSVMFAPNGSDLNAVWAVAQNIQIILIPPFALLGLRIAAARFRMKKRMPVFYVVMALAVFIFNVLCIYILAFAGALGVFFSYYRAKFNIKPPERRS